MLANGIPRRLFMISLGGVFALIAGLATFLVPASDARAVEIEHVYDQKIPIYGRTYLGDDEWSVVTFWYDLECIPDDYRFFGGDLVSFVQLRLETFDCPSTNVSADFKAADPPGRPVRQQVSGLGEVPVWLIHTADLMASLDGEVNLEDVIFWPDLQKLDHLEGVAQKFEEVNLFDPHHGNGKPFVHMIANGVLEDGRSFDAMSTFHLWRDGLGVPSNPEEGYVHIR